MRKYNKEIENRLVEAIHNVEMECGKMSEVEIELLRKNAYGEISDEEYFETILKMAGVY